MASAAIATVAEVAKYTLFAVSVALVGVGTKTAVDKVVNSKTNKKTSKKQTKKNSDETLHNVYVLRDSSNNVQYVGRTTNLEATEIRHENNLVRAALQMKPIAIDVSKETARGLEQMLIMNCRTLNRNRSFPINNQINGVSIRNPKYNLYWDSATQWVSENEHLVPCK